MEQVIHSKRVILAGDGRYILYKKGCLYFSEDLDKKEKKICVIPAVNVQKIWYKFSILERMFRLMPQCAAWVDKNSFIFAQKGHIYFVNLQSGIICLEHNFIKGMRAPLNFCKVEEKAGFHNCIIYGTYSIEHGNVSIWKRDEYGKWEEVYIFPENMVLHIHNIIPDYQKNRFLILTGDTDEESGIWEASCDFTDVHALLVGKQQYRACVAFLQNDSILFATDTPLENNYLYEYKESINALKPIIKLPGPVIYGVEYHVNETIKYLFATSVEPDSRRKGIFYLISNQLGPGIQDYETHVFEGNMEEGFREICKFEKDCWPMGLFQFGNVLFPSGKTKKYLICPQGVKKYDGKTLEVTKYEL